MMLPLQASTQKEKSRAFGDDLPLSADGQFGKSRSFHLPSVSTGGLNHFSKRSERSPPKHQRPQHTKSTHPPFPTAKKRMKKSLTTFLIFNVALLLVRPAPQQGSKPCPRSTLDACIRNFSFILVVVGCSIQKRNQPTSPLSL